MGVDSVCKVGVVGSGRVAPDSFLGGPKKHFGAILKLIASADWPLRTLYNND